METKTPIPARIPNQECTTKTVMQFEQPEKHRYIEGNPVTGRNWTAIMMA